MPFEPALFDAKRMCEPEKTVHHVFTRHMRDLVGGEQPLKIVGALAVETEANGGMHKPARNACAQCHLHMQQQIETLAGKSAMQFGVSFEAGRLVERNEVDARNIAYQRVFQFSHDPGESAIRPGMAQRVYNRKRVAHIAHRGEAQRADALRGMIEMKDTHAV